MIIISIWKVEGHSSLHPPLDVNTILKQKRLQETKEKSFCLFSIPYLSPPRVSARIGGGNLSPRPRQGQHAPGLLSWELQCIFSISILLLLINIQVCYNLNPNQLADSEHYSIMYSILLHIRWHVFWFCVLQDALLLFQSELNVIISWMGVCSESGPRVLRTVLLATWRRRWDVSFICIQCNMQSVSHLGATLSPLSSSQSSFLALQNHPWNTLVLSTVKF